MSLSTTLVANPALQQAAGIAIRTASAVPWQSLARVAFHGAGAARAGGVRATTMTARRGFASGGALGPMAKASSSAGSMTRAGPSPLLVASPFGLATPGSSAVGARSYFDSNGAALDAPGGGDVATLKYISKWPYRKMNTVLNVVPQGTVHIIERFGQMESIQQPGFYLRIPLLDRVAYVVDVRERSIPIHPQHAITNDNVSVQLDGVVMIKVVDPVRAAYGAFNPYMSVVQHCMSTMRAALGRRTLDEAFHDRAGLNKDILSDVAQAADDWGLKVTRYEVLNIMADATVAKAMDLQATAERKRREEVTAAEADKRSRILRAEGEAAAIERRAEASKKAAVLEAEGKRAAIALEAAGDADAIRAMAGALGGDPAAHQTAATLQLANAYFKALGDMGAHSNTMFFGGAGNAAGDVAELVSKLTTTVNATVAGTSTGGSSAPLARAAADLASAGRV